MKWLDYMKCHYGKGHQFIRSYDIMLHCGMSKVIIYKCVHCGKEKPEFI